jgi:hypothetical protein
MRNSRLTVFVGCVAAFLTFCQVKDAQKHSDDPRELEFVEALLVRELHASTRLLLTLAFCWKIRCDLMSSTTPDTFTLCTGKR